MKKICQVTAKNAEDIESLRIQEFRRSAQFSLLKAEKLKWGVADDASVVLAAWDDAGRVVSTMRGAVASTQAQAEAILHCSVPEALAGFPAMVLTIAATQLELRDQGFNSTLRYYFFLAAKQSGIASMLGAVYLKAPRMKIMFDIGYQVHEPQKNWQNKLKPKSQRVLAYLNQDRFDYAIDKLGRLQASMIQDYPWMGPPIEFPASA